MQQPDSATKRSAILLGSDFAAQFAYLLKEMHHSENKIGLTS
jgi:hypothetical protein